jgi:hypothetical protein
MRVLVDPWIKDDGDGVGDGDGDGDGERRWRRHTAPTRATTTATPRVSAP